MALTPKPKTRDQLGKNPSGTRLSWPARLDWIAFTPKPATFDRRLGKNIWEPVYQSKGAVALSRALFENPEL